MKLIAACGHSTRAAGLKSLQKTRSALSAVLQRLPWLAGRVARKTPYDLPQARRNFLGFHCCPTGVKVSDAALSRRDVNVARLYEQGASKKRIAQYLGWWLGWVLLVTSPSASGLPTASGLVGTEETCPPTLYPYANLKLNGALTTFAASSECSFALSVSPNTSLLDLSNTTNGSISCTGPNNVNSYIVCSASPNTGFAAGVWGGDECSGPAATACTLSNTATAKTVSATFTAIPGYVPTGPVVQILIDPTTPTTLYSALDGGGVYTKVGADNWTAATTQPSNLNVKALAIKSDSSMLFAGTDGGGVFKSLDSGTTWAVCTGQPANLNLRSLALAGTSLYAGTTAGVFVSTDACASWAAVNTGMP